MISLSPDVIGRSIASRELLPFNGRSWIDSRHIRDC